MGANYADMTVAGKNAGEAFDKGVKTARYQHGHSGYTGTMAEKDNYVYIGQLPARVTYANFPLIAERYTDWKRLGYWNEPTYKEATEPRPHWAAKEIFDGYKKRTSDPRPKALQTPTGAVMLTKWGVYAEGDKWGPAAAVRLNTQEERKYKASFGLGGTRQQVFYFGGYCSS